MQSVPFRIDIFLLGCVGALAPDVVRLYKGKYRRPTSKRALLRMCLALMFALLGGVVAWIMPATTLDGAFYAGVSLPVLVMTVAKEARGKRRESGRQTPPASKEAPGDMKEGLSEPVHAEDAVGPDRVPPATVVPSFGQLLDEYLHDLD